MKNLPVIAIVLVVLSSCSPNNTKSKITELSSDSLVTNPGTLPGRQALTAVLRIADTIRFKAPILLRFTVHNRAGGVQQFCKWHTPFEPLMSKYLEVRDAEGVEADYKGAMTKRRMPPPVSSYIKVSPKDSATVTTDLLKAFNITKPSKYTVKYVGQNMSGLIVADSISFVYTK